MKNIFIILILCMMAMPAMAKNKILVPFQNKHGLGTTADLTYLGIQLALSEFKDKENYELVRLKIGPKLTESHAALTKAIKQHSPVAILGGINSNNSIVISEFAEKHKIPFITPFSTNPIITRDKGYTYRTCFDDNTQARKIAKYLVKKFNHKRGLVLTQNTSAFSAGISRIFIDSAKGYGADIEQITYLKIDDLLERIKKRKGKSVPQFIFLPAYQIQSAKILSKISALFPKETVYFGPDSWGGGRMFHTILKESLVQFKGFYVQHWSAEYASAHNRHFAKLVKTSPIMKNSQFNSTAMNAPIAVGYDAGTFLFGAIALAKTSGESINSAIKKVSVPSTTGLLKMGPQNTPNRPLFIYKIDNYTEEFLESYK